MLSGTVPFKPANLKELNKVIQKGEYPPIPDISKEAAHLINGLLEIDPKKRFTIEKVMNHPWLIMNSNDKSDENKLMLFTKAEMVLLSKANVDYRTSNKDEMMENFTLKNLDTNNDKCNKNVTTKSFIFAPFNSTFISISEGDNNENEISIEKSVIKFNNETQALNRIYELNYNGEIDHGVLIQHHSLSNQDEQKGNNQQQLNGGASLSLNENEILNNNSLISGECYDDLETPISPRIEGNIKNELQRNLTSLTNTSTQLIDENVLKICESLGYGKEYMQVALASNELNYATTTYYLLCCANDCGSY
jgi:serine/threonine protein kinase